jgi:glycosyltransferase involved in cell wall biosynthesis
MIAMKLIIQIPCYNEAGSLPVTLRELPREVPGFDAVEWLIIDDGSSDDTVQVARRCGVDHVVPLKRNKGLATGFLAGLDRCLALGADVIVNLDADNQYHAGDIPKLVKPIVDGQADVVIGVRPISDIAYFSPIKKLLQKFGSWVVRKASATEIEDAPSGYRAFSREAAMKINVFNSYTYTLETIIQAGQLKLDMTSVPIRVNGFLRESRLVRSIRSYVQRSILMILRASIIYSPFRFFMRVCGSLLLLAGISASFFLVRLLTSGQVHQPSLAIAAILAGAALLTTLIAVLGDLISTNRRLLEDIRFRVRKLEADGLGAFEDEAPLLRKPDLVKRSGAL